MVIDLDRELPQSLGECVDYLRDLRDLRIAIEKEAALIAEKESATKRHILAALSEQAGTTGVAGKRYRAQRTERRVASVKDWTALYGWIRDTGRFDVLQKRLLNSAVIDMWEADEDVPGCEPAIVVDLSVTKV